MVDTFKDKKRKDKRVKQGKCYWLASEVYKDLFCYTFRDFLDKIISLKQEDDSLDIELTEFKDYILTPEICVNFFQKEIDNIAAKDIKTLSDFKKLKELKTLISYMNLIIEKEQITDELIFLMDNQHKMFSYHHDTIISYKKEQLLDKYLQEEKGTTRNLAITNNQEDKD